MASCYFQKKIWSTKSIFRLESVKKNTMQKAYSEKKGTERWDFSCIPPFWPFLSCLK